MCPGLQVSAELCLRDGDSRPGLSLTSGDSSDCESGQEGSEGCGSPMEMGRQ